MSGHAFTAEGLRPRQAVTRSLGEGAAGPLGLAGICLLALVLVWAAFSHVPAVQLRDAALLHDFTLLNRPILESVGNFLLHLLEPALFVLWGAALVAVALARSKPRLAVAIAAVMALAPFTSETLKPLLAHPHYAAGEGLRIGPASWPSGHSTAALTLVLCAVLVTPARLRPLVAFAGAGFTVAVGFALLVLAWHMPSDVLGGYLVATLWTALAVASLRLAEGRWPTGRAQAQAAGELPDA
jgi:membrane-associated phospholipid phosphatase